MCGHTLEYIDSHPGSTLADARRATQATPPADKGVSFVDPKTHKLVRVEPGGNVPDGAVSPSGYSSQNVPTAATRTMVEAAPKVVTFVDRINQLINENEQSLGPLKGRWSEFTAGRIGLKDKGYTKLRTDIGLLQTALMRMHVGARGGSEMMEHFRSLIDQSSQDPDNLRAALEEIKAYAQTVAGGHNGGQSTNAPPVNRPPLSDIFK